MTEEDKHLMSPTEDQIAEIQSKYPSICYTCERARRPASLELRSEGYVGCTLLLESERFKEPHLLSPNFRVLEEDIPDIMEAEILCTGWVNLSVALFGQDGRKDFHSGVATNCMLMTRKCSKCKYHELNEQLIKVSYRKVGPFIEVIHSIPTSNLPLNLVSEAATERGPLPPKYYKSIREAIEKAYK